MTPLQNSILFTIGCFLLVLVGYDISRWIEIANSTASFEEAKALYLDRFPSSFNNARYITAVEMLLLLISVVCLTATSKTKTFRVTSIIGVSISIFLLCWLGFSLM